MGGRFPTASGDGPREPCGFQPYTPQPHRPEAPAPGHPASAVHPAPLGAGRPGLPSVQQHWSLPVPRYLNWTVLKKKKLLGFGTVHVFLHLSFILAIECLQSRLLHKLLNRQPIDQDDLLFFILEAPFLNPVVIKINLTLYPEWLIQGQD